MNASNKKGPAWQEATWVDKAYGRYLLTWQQQQCDRMVADIFGYHSVQLGLGALHGLRASRIAGQWLAAISPDWGAACMGDDTLAPEVAVTMPPVAMPPWDASCFGRVPQLACHPQALPFADASLDLIILPHTLERCAQPHQVLREVERVLVNEGRALLLGLNPLSLRGLQHLGESLLPVPESAAGPRALGMSCWRLRDWLQLLGLEVLDIAFGCHAPVCANRYWLRHWRWLDSLGQRAWPVLGGAYALLAVKRHRTVRPLVSPDWALPTSVTAPVSVAAAASALTPVSDCKDAS